MYFITTKYAFIDSLNHLNVGLYNHKHSHEFDLPWCFFSVQSYSPRKTGEMCNFAEIMDFYCVDVAYMVQMFFVSDTWESAGSVCRPSGTQGTCISGETVSQFNTSPSWRDARVMNIVRSGTRGHRPPILRRRLYLYRGHKWCSDKSQRFGPISACGGSVMFQRRSLQGVVG